MVSRRLLRIKVLKTFYSYLKAESHSPTNAEKELAFSIKKTYDLYHYLLLLLLEIADYAELKIDLGKQKHLPTKEEQNPNTKFISNAAIQVLRENEALKSYITKHKLGWIESSELVKKIYTHISESDYFKKYMATETSSFEEDKRLLVDIISNELDDHTELYDLLEDQSIYWVDDVEFVLSMIVRTIKQLKLNQPSIAKLLPLYKNEEDQQFAVRLLRRAINEYDDYKPLIERYVRNWEVERIAFMDTILLQLAIAEAVEFPNIPIKVTIDEYIELSKYFSTANSGTFINGVLDKVIQELTMSKKIVKSGRGLVDTTPTTS